MEAKPGKIALITGANKGIGFEIARQLGVQGMTVLIGARDATRRAEAVQALQGQGLDAHGIALDVTDPASIQEAAQQIEAQFGCLDVLVNNAGINLEWAKPSETDLTNLRATFDVNFFGVVNVTEATLPLLRRSKAGRIVNMSSGLGSLSRHADPNNMENQQVPLVAYNASKAALNMFTILLARELDNSGIKVNSVDPGYTATDMNNHQGYRTVAQGAATPVRLATLDDNGPTGGFFNDNGPIPW